MKKLGFILATIFLSSFQYLNAQQLMDTLNGNSISALINDEGGLFFNEYTTSAGYEFPSGSGNNLIFMGALWFGGTNQNGEVKLVTRLFDSKENFARGPISSTGQYLDTAFIYNYENAIWTVRKSQIIYHIDNFDQQGYIAPDVIKDWPGNGNSSIGVATQLAPYVDINNNGIYEPHLGDYPCIKGDMASYQIMHEDLDHVVGPNEKIGAEIHLMLYHVQSTDFIDSTTFIEVKVINRGQNSFNDFKATIFMDPDIGFSEDDYIGSAPSKNLVYAYNGDNFDEGQSGASGYGLNAPAIGLMSLNKDFEYSWTFNRSDLGTPATDDPSSPADFWNYMNGKWKDGTDWTYGGNGYGGTISANHFKNGNPYLGTGWTELNVDGNGNSAPIGDRRFFATTIGETFNPGDIMTFNYAVIVNRQGENLENVQGLIEYADSVQNYFDNIIHSCIQQGTGIADIFEEEEKNLNLNFEITRLDGEGNMSRAVTLHTVTENDILFHNSFDKIRYERGKGPIEARLTDTISHAIGHFVIKFNEYDVVDTANWTIYHYDSMGGNLLETVNSTSSIDVGNEQLIPQWGMAIRIKQENYVCASPPSICPEREKHALPLEVKLSFENNIEWLTGVKNTNAITPLNWIRSGNFFPQGNTSPNDSIFDPNCYPSNGYDPFNVYSKLADGIVSPSWLARANECYLAPMVISESVGNNSVFNSITPLVQAIIYQPSIDIVFTDDTTRWTRAPVIELNTFDQGSIGGGKAGFLRQSSSVDKLGNPDGSGTGMGWFPGYAIDVETGRRLNIAFGENSTLTNDNGDDMIWNPTERIFDNNGEYVLGGQHVIYVFGREEFGMPIYDQGAFIHQELSIETINGFQNVYANLSWVMQPLLKSGEQLNSSEARMRIRINKEFKTKILSNQNEGRPMFSWDAVPYDEIWLSTIAEPKIGKINIYPNPASNKITITWDEVKVDMIKINSYNGRLVKIIPVNGANALKGEEVIDINGLSSGVYYVNVGSEVRKLVIN
ncbi:T9SS type A sorting domain-containing protein [Brumimicrobium mesophilum]|uniref:T9SS type A sorting domain-containing protein n=1 Tax=Brumimicrobium mesophilum TaxID=392717 RepID=UPI00131E699C|nr:T9SS type A sorting domain-containing protein [Brumimicrobium mesophilum]